MLDVSKLAESKTEEANIKGLKSKVKSFAINYIFAIRKINPMLRYARGDLTKSECMMMAGYISDVNKQAMEVLFDLISLVEPVSGELVRDELSYAEAIDNAIRSGDYEEAKKEVAEKKKKIEEDKPNFTVPVENLNDKTKREPGDSKNFIKKMFADFVEGLKSGMGEEESVEKPEDKPKKRGRKRKDDSDDGKKSDGK